MTHADDTDGCAVLDRDGLDALLGAFRDRGWVVLGPTVHDGAIVLDELSGVADLPEGWTDEQGGGRYRLRRRDDGALFGYAVGPQSPKRLLFPPRHRLLRAERVGDADFAFVGAAAGADAGADAPDGDGRVAVLARPCEVHAIAVQDRVFLGGADPDPTYAARRARLFVVAVNCGAPSASCFCTSMGTGPRAGEGVPWDLALTEVLEGDHRFVVEPGSEAGADVLARVAHRPADESDVFAAERVTDEASRRMGRWLDTAGIHDLLLRNAEHPRWDDVAERCLACTNCTMVCPTCFCSTVEDVTDLDGLGAERWRRWDSCFTAGHSYIHGGAVRSSGRSRYRQWLTHKLATWIDQFGTSGCVGCGRCITWCPVAIDLTEEVRAIRATDRAGARVAAAPTGPPREGG